ncbi:MAG: MaoC/PaaZ C-terminal domain-containing protein [Desulfobacterales bacterium]
MTDIRIKAIQGLKTGDTFSVSRTFSRADVAQFADISRDDNPVHSSLSFARAKKFDGCICHGLLVASLLTEIEGGRSDGWLQACNFHLKSRCISGTR